MIRSSPFSRIGGGGGWDGTWVLLDCALATKQQQFWVARGRNTLNLTILWLCFEKRPEGLSGSSRAENLSLDCNLHPKACRRGAVLELKIWAFLYLDPDKNARILSEKLLHSDHSHPWRNKEGRPVVWNWFLQKKKQVKSRLKFGYQLCSSWSNLFSCKILGQILV